MRGRSGDPGQEVKGEAQKDWSRTLANWLGSPAGIRLARDLQFRSKSEADRRSSLVPPCPDEVTAQARAISIWQPSEIDGETVFRRPEPGPWGDHYASTRVLKVSKRPEQKRICFFGESVAAGYLYAPHLTPAKVLEDQLRAVDTQQSYEVIDLARTNETLKGLTNTVESALQLNPDLIVVFAGNNWVLLETTEMSPYVPSMNCRVGYAQALEQDGLLGPVERASRKLLEKSFAFFDRLARMAASKRIPVVLVIPEVNLADWENRQPVAWLPESGTRLWYEHYERGMKFLQQGAWVEAAREAHEMIRLDGYTCPTSQRMLARAHLEGGDLEEAKRACRAELDANQYATLGFLGAPQATPMVQGILERGAALFGFSTVDLRRNFQRFSPDQLPGRDLFLDYCHLTARGMHVAIAGVTAEVVRLLSRMSRQLEWEEVARTVPFPEIDPRAESATFLGAAIHNAHRLLTVGRKTDIIEHWCERALQASATAEDAMANLVAIRLDPGQELHRGHLRNLQSSCQLGFQHGLRYEHLDCDLIQAFEAVLKRTGNSDAVANLLGRQPGGSLNVDLACPRNLWEPLERFYPEVIASQDPPELAYYRSPWPASSFALFCCGSSDVELAITARLPAPSEESCAVRGCIDVEVNGCRTATLSLTNHWKKVTLSLSREHLVPGLNKLTFNWPLPQWRGEEALDRAIRRLQRGLQADIHPVFGEVAEIIAREY